jgi:hypothetical protein
MALMVGATIQASLVMAMTIPARTNTQIAT